MKNVVISWHNEYSKSVPLNQLAHTIVQVYVDAYDEVPTIEDLQDFIWKEEYVYDYVDEILQLLFPYDVDCNCQRTEMSDLNIPKDEFCKYLEKAIKDFIQYKTPNE